MRWSFRQSTGYDLEDGYSYIDEYAQIHERISVSAGKLGAQLLLAPEDYRRAVNGAFAPIAREKEA